MRIGVDLGGTKIETIVLSRDGKILFRKRVATPAGDYTGTINALVALIRIAEKSVGKSGLPVGIGIPGTISNETGLVKNANSVCLIGKPLDKDLAETLGRPVRLANDANCFALSEASDGAGVGGEVVFGVIVGTGTGGGVVVNGKVLIGANGIAGEWGHNPLPWPQATEYPGVTCYCGRSGCIETFISGTGLARDFLESCGKKLSSDKIAELAQKGDLQAEATLRRYEDRMARALATIINVLDPNIIVLGGGLSNMTRLYVNIPLLLQKYAFSDYLEARLVPALHGDSSGVRGAAWLWP